MSNLTLSVPDVSCSHCVASVTAAVEPLDGVAKVAVDLAGKRVEVEGERLDEAAIVVAIREAGYEPEAR